jgi:hypothetical protein
MGRIFNRRNVLLGIAAIVVLPILTYLIWLESASVRGKWAAHSDLARGHYKILAYGLPPAGAGEYKAILQSRYGVEYQQAAFCIVSPALMKYVDAYDGVTETAIAQKYGHDIFKKSWDEANRKFQEKHKAELQNVSRSE